MHLLILSIVVGRGLICRRSLNSNSFNSFPKIFLHINENWFIHLNTIHLSINKQKLSNGNHLKSCQRNYVIAIRNNHLKFNVTNFKKIKCIFYLVKLKKSLYSKFLKGILGNFLCILRISQEEKSDSLQ